MDLTETVVLVHTMRKPALDSYQRTGTLWDSRYKSSLIQTETYLLRCQRYIELNPVRADRVRDPGASPWSSYRANGLGASDPLVSPHALYLEPGQMELGL